MAKTNKKVDINQMLLKAHKLGVKKAIDVSARSNTRLVVCEGGKVKEVKPKYKYVRVLSKSTAKPLPARQKKNRVPSKSTSRSRVSRRKKDV